MEVIRVAMIGSGGVGKSSLVRRLGGHPFEPRYFPTVGREFFVLEFPGVRFEITEYAGQEQFSGIPQEELDAISSYIVVTTKSKVDCRAARRLMQKMPVNIPHVVVVNKNKNDNKNSNDYRIFCSVKRNENLIAPFRELASHFLNNYPEFWPNSHSCHVGIEHFFCTHKIEPFYWNSIQT